MDYDYQRDPLRMTLWILISRIAIIVRHILSGLIMSLIAMQMAARTLYIIAVRMVYGI